MKKLLARVKTTFQARRDAWPWFDHLIRAGQRYKADHGDRLAASLTMYLILALLPLMLLGISIVGYVLANDPDAQARLFQKITSVIPGVGGQLSEAMSTVKDNRGTLGIVGVGGLLFSGLGGIDALRDALRLMWHHDVDAGNFFKKKALDLVTVIALAVTLGISFVVSALATGGAGALLEALGIAGGAAKGILNVLTFFVGIAIDATLFMVLFKWLPRVDWPWRRLARGAVFGGVVFGLLKLGGAWYVGRTAARSSALYGSIGTAVAILIGLYLVSRAVLFTAAWTVTAPGWDDVEPSGTASPEAAKEAGIPVEAVTDPAMKENPHRLDPVGMGHGAASGYDSGDGSASAREEPAAKGAGGSDRSREREPAYAAVATREAAAPRPVTVADGAAARPAGTTRGAATGHAPTSAAAAAASGPAAAAPFGGSPAARRKTVLAARAVQGFVATVVAVVGVRGIRSLRRG
ncbi:MAG TPA: YihY/virulence factor BrkB family protein [Frankiaceae bacterium]|nr:YihY/virulence factor BrkB family protein [Frankiaceae bacterium]